MRTFLGNAFDLSIFLFAMAMILVVCNVFDPVPL